MLLEVTIAVGLIVLVLVAAARLTTQTIKTSRVRINRLQANKLANACLDLVRQDKDKDINAFFSEGHEYLKNCPCADLEGVNCVVGYVKVDDQGNIIETYEAGKTKRMYVWSTVYWNENGDVMSESNSTTFTEVSLL